jgi:hypothetical protein
MYQTNLTKGSKANVMSQPWRIHGVIPGGQPQSSSESEAFDTVEVGNGQSWQDDSSPAIVPPKGRRISSLKCGRAVSERTRFFILSNWTNYKRTRGRVSENIEELSQHVTGTIRRSPRTFPTRQTITIEYRSGGNQTIRTTSDRAC